MGVVTLIAGCSDEFTDPTYASDGSDSCLGDFIYGAKYEAVTILKWTDSQIAIVSAFNLTPSQDNTYWTREELQIFPDGLTSAIAGDGYTLSGYDTEPSFVLTNSATGAATSYCWTVGNNCQTTAPPSK